MNDQAHHPTPKVAVIGAGLAGLSCARSLRDHGIPVIAFDKGRGSGGRTATRRVEPDLAFDHGAQYFTARTPQFMQWVEAGKAQGLIATWHGRIVQLKRGEISGTPPRPRYVGVPGMSSVAAHLAAAIDVRRETRITRVLRSRTGWSLYDVASREFGPFEFVVIAVPAPQAAELLKPHEFAAKAANISMTPCWAVMVAFEEPMDVPWDGAFIYDSPLSWIARNNSKPGRPSSRDCWIVHAGPEWSAANLENSADAVGPALLEAFAQATGVPVPSAVYLAAHRWRYSQASEADQRHTLFDAEAGLVVCGDWLAGGRVEGAFVSGVAAANRIILQISRSPLPLIRR